MGEQGGGTPPRNGERRLLLLDLKDEPSAIARYDAAHRPGGVPFVVTDSIRAAGIQQMTIYRAGNRLVMLLETDAAFDPAAKARSDAAHPDIRAWEARMDLLQQRLPFAAEGEKWVEAACIFDLSQQPGSTTCD